MSKEIIKQKSADVDLSIMEKVLILGDLTPLSTEERFLYYTKVCESVGLNPLTKPFDYIDLNGQLQLYAKKDATDQLRKIHKVSTTIKARERVDDVFIVTALGNSPDGRQDEAIGAVPLLKWETKWDQQDRKMKRTGRLIPLNAEEYANAVMKAETKAKRRVTLSLVGLGMLDESELETIQDSESERIIINDEPEPVTTIESNSGKSTTSKTSSQPNQPIVNNVENPEDIKIYTLVDAKVGKTGKGTDYMLITAADQNDQKVEVYANTPEMIAAVNKITNVCSFEMTFLSENGINVIQNIVIKEDSTSNNPTSESNPENKFKLVEAKSGKSPNKVPYMQLKVQNLNENIADTLLVRDNSLFQIVNSIKAGEVFSATIEIQNGFKIVTGLPA